jgi:hypothetical protein
MNQPPRFFSASIARLRSAACSTRNSWRGKFGRPVESFVPVIGLTEARILSTKVKCSAPGTSLWYILFAGLLSAMIYLSTNYIDYKTMLFFIGQAIKGDEVMCVDLPPEIWSRIPKCMGLE